MARPLRIEMKGGVYYITSRGDKRQDIFCDDEDRSSFIELFGEISLKLGWKCHGYCLLSDHYHLLIETPKANLSVGMRQLNGVYTQRFNRRHDSVGHVFQGRYKSVVVERNQYLLDLTRHIVLNPVRTKDVKQVRHWAWSNYKATVGLAEAPKWLETEWTLSQFAKSKKLAIEKFIEFVKKGKNEPSVLADVRHQIYLGDDKFIKRMKGRLESASKPVAKTTRSKRNPAASAVKPLSFFDKKHKDKNVAMTQAYKTGSYSLKALGDYFDVHRSTVSRIVKS